MQTVSLTLCRFDTLAARAFAVVQMGAARIDLMRDPALGFWKLCGSGTGEGFTPRPNPAVWAILATWPDLATAQARVAQGQPWRRWRARAGESCTLFLTPVSARGMWSGKTPFAPAPDTGEGPIAAMTRATIRPARLMRFWRREPDVSAAIGADARVAFKIGLGEVPFLHQITFSVWPDAASMDRFARGDGPHARAIAAVRRENWFREELYARFRIAGTQGTWGGGDPLSRLQEAK